MHQDWYESDEYVCAYLWSYCRRLIDHSELSVSEGCILFGLSTGQPEPRMARVCREFNSLDDGPMLRILHVGKDDDKIEEFRRLLHSGKIFSHSDPNFRDISLEERYSERFWSGLRGRHLRKAVEETL